MDLQQAGAEYLRACSRRTDNSLTNTNRARLLSAFLSWADGRAVDADLLADYRHHLAQRISGRTRTPLTAATQAQYLRQAKAFCRWMADRDMMDTDIAFSVPAIRVSHDHRRDALSADDVRTILAGITGNSLQADRDRAAIMLAVVAGLRCCELAKLRCADLVSAGGYCAILVQGKGHADADTLQPIPRPLWEQLHSFAMKLPQHRAGDPLLPALDNAAHGRAVTPAGWSRIIKSRFAAAGYNSPRLTAHSLRHSAVTIGLQSGASLLELQQYARHADISTTTIYTHEHDRLTSKVPISIYQAITGNSVLPDANSTQPTTDNTQQKERQNNGRDEEHN